MSSFVHFLSNDLIEVSEFSLQMTIDERFFHHSFSYPDFSEESDDLQQFIANDLFEMTHKKALERSGEEKGGEGDGCSDNIGQH